MKKQTKILKISTLKMIFLIIMLFCVNSFSANMYKVLYVNDGDTIAVKKTENNKETGKLIKVRLYGIDAPELNQDYGYASKEILIKLIRGKIVRIEGNKNDRYGRLLGTVYYNNENINERMVATGNAWWYEKYDKKNIKLKQLQENAQKNKFGLFGRKGYVAPWEFRKMKRNRK